MNNREKLTDQILGLLTSTYVTERGEEIKGQSISFLHQELRDYGWKGLGHLNDFESLVESLGFTMVKAQLIRFGKAQRFARVVTL